MNNISAITNSLIAFLSKLTIKKIIKKNKPTIYKGLPCKNSMNDATYTLLSLLFYLNFIQFIISKVWMSM